MLLWGSKLASVLGIAHMWRRGRTTACNRQISYYQDEFIGLCSLQGFRRLLWSNTSGSAAHMRYCYSPLIDYHPNTHNIGLPSLVVRVTQNLPHLKITVWGSSS